MFDFNLEAMQAHLQSKFGSELDALWQEMIDYRDNDLKGMSFKSRSSALKKLFTGKIAKKFTACVWKNTGLHIEEVHLTSLFWGSFCTWMYFDKKGGHDQTGTAQIENILNGGYLSRSTFGLVGDTKHFSADQLIKISKSYDTIRGSIKEAARLEIRKLLKSSIGFDVDTAFLIEDQIAKNSGVQNFTAREITAIVLHEIGHTLTLVEHAGDGYARMASFKYLTTAFRAANDTNIDEVTKLAEIVADELAKRGDEANSKKVREVSKKLKKDISSAGSAAQNHMVRNSIVGFLETLFCFIGDVIYVPLTMVFGNQQGTRFSSKEQKVKVGDLPVNGRMINWQERKADEYAFTNGYGADQSTALRKLQGYFDRIGLSEDAVSKLNVAERVHQELGFFEKMHLLVLAPCLANDYGYSLYPAGVARLRELLNLTIQQLKMYSTDPSYVTKYMQDIETILSKIDNPSMREEYVARMYRGYDIFMKYCSLPSFIDYIVDGRIKRELEDLINDVDKIGNNLLTFYGLKIQQLTNK